jgi:hypothetical protein
MTCKGIYHIISIPSLYAENLKDLPLAIRGWCNLILVNSPLPRSQARTAGQRWQSPDKHILRHVLGGLLQRLGQARLALLLGRHEGLLARLADELDLGARRAADRQERGELRLVDDAELGVGAARVALPVGVVGDVARGERHRVVVLGGRVRAGRGVAEVGVQRDAVGSLGVDGEEAAERLPQAGGLEGVFL